MDKKISVIIPAYNAAKSIPNTLDCILTQTYKNIEVIIVNDASSDTTLDVLSSYAEEYNTINVINLKKNVGPLTARVVGAKEASGDYIAFADADDTMSIDFYRSLLFTAETNNSDIVMSETVIDDVNTNRRYIYTLANDFSFDSLTGESIFKNYIEQNGYNYLWHVVWNKLIKKSLWDKAAHHYESIEDRIIMTDDIALSTPLWFYAKRVDRNPNVSYFYAVGEKDAATTTKETLSYHKAIKSIVDVQKVLNFFDKFLQEQNIYKTYSTNAKIWRKIYSRTWYYNVNNSKISAPNKNKLFSEIEKISPYNSKEIAYDSRFYDITTPWNEGLEDIRKLIVNPDIRAVSFDMFDTLVSRPFHTPSDMFRLMDASFKKLAPQFTVFEFYDLRTRAEASARQTFSDNEDVTLDQIYSELGKLYDVDEPVLQKMKSLEIDYELRFCKQRVTAYGLYQLVLYLGKKIAITTDMYLPEKVLKNILDAAGYENWNSIYLSSSIGKTKYNGTSYPFVAKDLGINSSNILHIGDNVFSDYTNALEKNFKAALFPRAIDVFEGTNFATAMYSGVTGFMSDFIGKEYFGNRTFLTLVANRFFDNPFNSFDSETAFNASPSVMGYFALGMHMYGTVQWLHQDALKEKYKNLVFCARDGYLPLNAYRLLFDEEHTTAHYFPVSRKAMLPLSIFTSSDIGHIDKFMGLHNKTIGELLGYFSDILIDEKQITKLLDKHTIDINAVCTDIEYSRLTNFLKECVDISRADVLRNAFIEKFGNVFTGNVAVYDIGYSAKPEQIVAKILNKKVDVYFTHTNSDGALRGVQDKNLHMHNFYNFTPAITGGLREVIASEQGPSCIKYALDGSSLQVVYEDSYSIDYYEKFVISTIQNNALRFIQDLKDYFGEHLSTLVYTNQYISLPFEHLLNTPTVKDQQIFKPIPFEDDIGLGRVDDITSINTYAHIQASLQDQLHGQHKVKKALIYLLLDRGHLIGKVKHSVSSRTSEYPIIHRSLKKSYGIVKWTKNRLRS